MSAAGGLTPEGAKLFRIRKTACKMLDKRGYAVADEELAMDTEDFRGRFGEVPSRPNLNLLVGKKSDPSYKLFVYFPPGDFGMQTCKDFLKQALDVAAKRAIIVFGGRLSSPARQVLQAETAIAVEFFREEELLIDITEHELVPEHVVLNDDEKAKLLARYKLRETQLPRMQLADPVARYYGMSRGQVFKIIRPSETAGRYVTYRIVV